MPKKPPIPPLEGLITAWKTSARVTEYMLEKLDASLWRAEPPGEKGRAGRTVAEIVAHVHNVRRMLVIGAGAKGPPPKLDRHRVDPETAARGLAKSAAAIVAVLEHAAKSEGRLPNAPHSAVTFFTSVITHEAHHRGQITMLARQLGHAIPVEVALGMWETSKRRKEAAQIPDS
jgi:uncharacterized damage-inducible protein DinB